MYDKRKKYTILLVDDSPENIDLIGDILKQTYNIKVALSGETALKIARSDNPPDIILLDIMMPNMDGYEVCQRLKSDTQTHDIPVIFVTSMGDTEDETKGLEIGAIDYIAKPINSGIVKARVKNHLELKEAREYLKNQNEILESRVKERTRQILELQRVEFELRSEQEKVEKELNIAAQIQKSILPDRFPGPPEYEQFDLHAMMTPAYEVGGDFYDFFFVDDDHLTVIIADVADKGIPAALFSMISRTIFRSIAKQGKSVSQVISETNSLLCEGNSTGMFVTAFLANYHIPTGQFHYSNGGHNPALLISVDGVCRKLNQKHGPALGIRSEISYDENIDSLEPGQILVLYTDGVTEASSPQGTLFGLERFASLVSNYANYKPFEILKNIDRDLIEFQQGNQFDDTTVLVIKREI
jgi:sigma-B regulation protein RsbU (phosphoserine phosphatase)